MADAHATHATLATFEMDPALDSQQQQGLREMIVPGVRKAPGFVAGYWTRDRSTNRSYAMVLFESEAAAEKLADNVRSNAANQSGVGISLQTIIVVEITAQAEAETSVEPR